MSLYNSYRPARFVDVLGQDSTVAILKRQAKLGKFGHSYLLHGPSGTGKTSTARILAASMNCLNGVANKGEPCGECQPCEAIQRGSFWDVIEVDGARFRGIEEAKSLVYKAFLSPLNGGKKVYIIDEAHALTPEAFNVLLKLLEEPPPNVCIILCTTEAEKIPSTVKSRCQQYSFGQLSPGDIKAKLQRICRKERVRPDPKHLEFISTTACGNMRAAENVLEQVLVLGKKGR